MGGEPSAPSQFGAMEAAFHKAGLKGYEFDGSRVKVPHEQPAAYMAALADEQALPASFGSYLGKVVSSTNPFTSKLQQQEMLKVAKQNELQFIIGKMKGIETASVLYDIQSKRGFGQEDVITASVNVKPMGTAPLDFEREYGRCASFGGRRIAGLKPETVTITDLNGNVYPGSNGTSGGIGGEDDKYASVKKMYDKVWETKLVNALIHIPGVVVTVNAELDPETEHEESRTEFDPKAVAVESRETTGGLQADRQPAPAGLGRSTGWRQPGGSDWHGRQHQEQRHHQPYRKPLCGPTHAKADAATRSDPQTRDGYSRHSAATITKRSGENRTPPSMVSRPKHRRRPNCRRSKTK